jgi:hypothetical protein
METHPLVRKFPKSANTPPPYVPWWEPVVPYLLLTPGVLTWFVGGVVFAGYWACADENSPGCVSVDLLRSSTGDYTGIVRTVAVCYAVSVICAVLVQLTVRKLHFAIVWVMAGLCTATAITAVLILNGNIGTPWGRLLAEGG